MRYSYPHSIDSLLNGLTKTEQEMSLLKIQQHVTMLLKLNRTINMLLPMPLRLWCRVANIRQGVLILETINASWKTRLLYEQTRLLSSLKAQILPSLTSITIRINPSLTGKQKVSMLSNDSDQQVTQILEKQPRYLSAQSAASIRYMAVRSKGKLKHVLERLANLAMDSTNTTHSDR